MLSKHWDLERKEADAEICAEINHKKCFTHHKEWCDMSP